MLRRLFSITFLAILMFAGSGISYMVGEHFIRANAIDRKQDIASGVEITTSLRLSAESFNALKRERINDEIFEVVLNGIHYDIYNTQYNSDGSITLSAFRDTPENELLISTQEKETSGKNTLQLLPFFFFPFHNESNSFQLFTTELSVLSITHETIPLSSVKGCDSPPPDLYVA